MSRAGDGDTFGRDETNYVDDWEKFVRGGHYGHLQNDETYYSKVKVYVPSATSYSDYSGSLVERANAKTFRKEFSDSEDEAWTEVPGGHGTSAIVILAEALTPEMEAWSNFYEREFVKLIKPPVIEVAVDEFPDADPDLIEEMVDEAVDALDAQSSSTDFGMIFEMFNDAREAANIYWEEQTGGDMYIDMKRVVDKGLAPGDVLDYLVDNKLLDTRPFLSEDERQLWVARRNANQLPLKFDGLRGRRKKKRKR